MMNNYQRASNVDSAAVIQVIQIYSIVGKGVEGDPARRIVEYYSMDGQLLARRDGPVVEGAKEEAGK